MNKSRAELAALPKVGFFAPNVSNFPNPEGYPAAKDCVDAAWEEAERHTVIAYMDGVGVDGIVASYRGMSLCRICGTRNGSTDISDGAYVWPSGYTHYLEAHTVKPPQAFIDHVLNRIQGGRNA